MTARRHDSSDPGGPSPREALIEAEQAFARLPDGDYRLPDLYAISPTIAAAALYILGGKWAEPYLHGTTGQGHEAADSLHRRILMRKHPAAWGFRVRDGQLVELVPSRLPDRGGT
jgi:hypothetical protein